MSYDNTTSESFRDGESADGRVRDTIAQRLISHLESRVDVYIETLRLMVETNSFTENREGVRRHAEQVSEAFAPLGFIPEYVPAADERYGSHLVLTRPGRTDRRIILVSHLDTVFPPEEEESNDFRWRVVGEKAYGPGTVDIKGGTVVALMALEGLRAVESEAFDEVTWVVLCNAAEERLVADFEDLCLSRLGSDPLAALVFEGGQIDSEKCTLVEARKGMAIYEIGVDGKSQHAGNRHRSGVSANLQLAKLVDRIESLTDYDRGLTFNVGVIAGGTVPNRVSHVASATGEMRAFTSEVFDFGIEGLEATCREDPIESADGSARCDVSLDIRTRCIPWPPNAGTSRLVEVFRAAAAGLGLEVGTEQRGGVSDGNRLYRHVPTIDGLGPAGANAHCSIASEDGSREQEYTRLSTFVPKAALNALAMIRLIGADL